MLYLLQHAFLFKIKRHIQHLSYFSEAFIHIIRYICTVYLSI